MIYLYLSTYIVIENDIKETNILLKTLKFGLKTKKSSTDTSLHWPCLQNQFGLDQDLIGPQSEPKLIIYINGTQNLVRT